MNELTRRMEQKSVRLPPEVWLRLEDRVRRGTPLYAPVRSVLLEWLESSRLTI